MIRQMSDREHVIARPAMYIGAVDVKSTNEYVLDEKLKKMVYTELEYVPGFIKIINEIIDNCVDVAIKTKFASCTHIGVKITDEYIEVTDDGTGIPVLKSDTGKYLPELAWGHARAGSNFDDDDNRTQIGMNGVGSFATNCFSTKFIGKTDDGKNKYTITFKNNADSFTESVQPSTGKTGTTVKFYPDLAKFGLSTIDDIHKTVIKQRLINLSLSYPAITFKFNNKRIAITTFKKYVQLFGDVFELFETDNYQFAILPNDADDFKHFSYVNGLKIPDGGTHIDIFTSMIVQGIRSKLVRRFKSIKPGDIKNKLMMIAFIKDFPNLKFNSQAKEKITNSVPEMNAFLHKDGPVPYDALVNKIYKNSAMIDPITEVYRIKEEFKRRQEMKGLQKTVKRIKSEKYSPSIKTKKYLMLVEGESAFGGCSPVFGRRECGYYVLRGKPLNAYSSTHDKFMKNKELSELFKIINNEKYERIVYATDQDLDGFHIRGLLTGFFKRYMPEIVDRISVLQTPVICITKNEKPVRWHYNLSDDITVNKGESSDYKKGLGSWDEDDLKYILAVDGINKMIEPLEFNSDEIIEEWMGTDSEPRKKYILENEFSIAKL